MPIDRRNNLSPSAQAKPGSLGLVAALLALSAIPVSAQSTPELRQILQRLDRLEEQNRALAAEVRDLKSALALARGNQPPEPPPQPTAEERIEVQESRTKELAATKVEAASRFPIRIAGMALFNSYLNSKGSGGGEYSTIAQPGGEASGGATVRQSIVGLDYNGPTALGAKIGGSLRLDFWAGSGQPLDQTIRVRTAEITMDWKNTSFLVGVDKPIIAPRDPDSLAQVAFSPLTAAGNLWLWSPQVRLQHDFHFSQAIGLRAQVGVVQTHEVNGSPVSPYTPNPAATSASYVEPARPGGEGRLELFAGTARRFEIASSIHRSVSQVMGKAVPSDVYAIDWLARPWRAFEFTGTAFTGQNVTPLGTGAIDQGFVLLGPGRANAVHSRGGWAQMTFRPAARLWFNFFSGQQDDRNSDLPRGGIGKNLVFGANIFYRLAPNVVVGFETTQTRTNYIGTGTLLNNHYDLAFAYMF